MSLREAQDAYHRAKLQLQTCPRDERTFRALQLRKARHALRVAQAQAALAAPVLTAAQRRAAELDARTARWVAA
jgi:hypothetical protein